jgi:hypothetical protein
MQVLGCCQQASADKQLLAKAFQQHESFDFFDYSTYSAVQLHPHLKAVVVSE